LETVEDRRTVTMEDWLEIVYGLSKCTIFSDFEWPLSNQDFKGTPLFGIEYLRNDTRYMVTTDQWNRSGLWLIEFCHHQWPCVTFEGRFSIL